ncbi:hypothetical protein CBR_g54633 [Chara braunii]|uniref:Reverse transcriptase RNase H-like domain-containing protein n=1 Tax=Chara braunii TaxID=69332 RepID=A0A388MC95_CHABU|nr:hypothetical protein CBR_g54633 [Chara braunii]|eukprot:GBG92188.1 hypothetical protein CBR_g54633 [Chara braunii]
MSGGGGAAPRKALMLDDLVEALDKRERAPSNVPKVDTFHFKGERVSDWLDLTEQAPVGLSDEVKFQRILKYILHSHHREVSKVVDATNGSWARFRDLMMRKYRLGDSLLTMADLEAMNKDEISTIGAFVHEFKKKARKVHGISEEAQCAIFLGLLTSTEASELTSHGGGSEKLTWATIDKRVEEGSLDQAEQHQMRLQRRKRKERDATASGTPGVKRIVTDVLAAVGYDNEAKVQKRGVTGAPGRTLGAVDEETGREDYGGEETGSQEEEEEGGDEEDERLRQEEDRRAEQRAKKRGVQEEVEPSLRDSVPKRKKCAVRMEEGFDVERMVDRFLEGRNDLMNLKDILASAPKLRDSLKGRLSRSFMRHCVQCDGGDWEGEGAGLLLCYARRRSPHPPDPACGNYDGTMILALSDPACGNYKIIKCRNTGPGSGRNRPNLGSFTFEESEYERRRLREGPEEEGTAEVLSLSLTDVNRAMEVVAAHDMADPEEIKALREQVLESSQVGEVELVYRLPGGRGGPAMAQARTTNRPFLEEGSQRRYKTIDKKCRPVAVLVTEDEEAYYERERGLIRRMREHPLARPCRINDENEGKLIIGEPDFFSPQERTLMVETMKKRHRAYAFDDDERGRLDMDKIPMIRIHTDLQLLNAVTVRDVGGLSNADALSESCAGRPIISVIDLYSGYDQFPVYPPDRPVTAMHTARGLIHMNVASQGWTNAVAMVQRHMIRAMQTVSPHITQPYIDDLAVKGPKEKEEDEVVPGVRQFVWKHIQDIDQVLGLLEEHNLTASGPKSKHCMREVTILGFVCNEKGRRPDVKKIDKIIEWPMPFHSITDVRSFLGTCGFWRSFVKDFAAKTEHLRKLVRQDQEWVWGKDQEEAVDRMKGEFKEGGLVLGAPNYEATEEKPFVIETGDGPTALGGVLIQADAEGKERPLRFESRTLNITERNYSQFKKETLAVLHCLRTFRNYVFGRRLVLRVDPSDPTVVRWLTYIWMFNFELERIPGNKNRADGLSRVNWDRPGQESIEDTPSVDGFLLQEEDIRLHINEWSLRVPSCVSHSIWLVPRGYKQKAELVLKPFQEEDPWGGKDVHWMMELALADTHSLAEEVTTIEEGPTKVEEHEQLMGGMYLLTNTLLQGDFDRRGSLNPVEGEGPVPESQDDEFEEGEIKEAFRAEEYDGIYRELGLLLSCEIRDRDVSDTAQRARHLYVVRDGHLFIKRQVGNPRRVVCGRNRQIDIIAALHDGIAEGAQRASRLGEGSDEPVRYVPIEEPLDPEAEADIRDRGEPQDPGMVAEQQGQARLQAEEVITVGDDTPPGTSVPGQARQPWPEGISEPDSEEISELPPEIAALPEQGTEMERQGAGERARVSAIPDLSSAMYMAERPGTEGPAPVESPPALPSTSGGKSAGALTPRGRGPRVGGASKETREEKSARVRVRLAEIHARQAEMEEEGIASTPPVDPKTSEQRIDELWARYEGQRDAARQRSRETGQADERVDELKEAGDLGFSATRMAIERVDGRIHEVAITSFRRYSLLSDELAARILEVEHLTTQLAEERATSQARKIEWERRFGELAAIVNRLSAAGVAGQNVRAGVDVQDRGTRVSPRQGAAVEPLRQRRPTEEASRDPIGMEAIRRVEEETVGVGASIEVAMQPRVSPSHEACAEGLVQGPRYPLAKGGSAQESLMVMSDEKRGSRLHELAAAMGIGTPQERPQRLDTPEYAPRLGELRAELGSWATGIGSGGHSSEQQQQEVMSGPAAAVVPRPSGPCGDEVMAVAERPYEGGPQRLDTPEYRPKSIVARGVEAVEPRSQGHMGLPLCHEVTTETEGGVWIFYPKVTE